MVLKKLFKLFKKTKKRNTLKKREKRVSTAKINKIKKKKINVKSLKKQVMKREVLVADIIHYYSKIKVAILKMKKTLEVNDTIHIKGYTTDFKQSVVSIQLNHSPINIAKKGQEIGLLVKGKVRHKDKVFKI